MTRRAAAIFAVTLLAAVLLGARAHARIQRPGGTTIELTVNARAGRHPISPYIYGLNFAGPKLASAIQLPVNRWGGDTTDDYNWRLGSYDEGADWYFEDLSDCFLKRGPCTPAYRKFVARDKAWKAKTLLNLPLVGYVARDAPRQHPVTCGFPVSVLGAQDQVDPYDHRQAARPERSGARILGMGLAWLFLRRRRQLRQWLRPDRVHHLSRLCPP